MVYRSPATRLAALVTVLPNLPAVVVNTYKAELRNPQGFIGDRASKRAFQNILEDWCERLRMVGDDPLGDRSTEDFSKKKLDKLLVEGDPKAAGLGP
jgi:hypothetical protein